MISSVYLFSSANFLLSSADLALGILGNCFLDIVEEADGGGGKVSEPGKQQRVGSGMAKGGRF